MWKPLNVIIHFGQIETENTNQVTTLNKCPTYKLKYIGVALVVTKDLQR